jgi:hypothetical protein
MGSDRRQVEQEHFGLRRDVDSAKPRLAAKRIDGVGGEADLPG